MSRNDNVTVAAFLRPRSLFLGVLGFSGASIAGLWLYWWMFPIGLMLTAGGYAWSVADSLRDREFVEAMARPGLAAGVSDDARLAVSARRGGRSLNAEWKERHRVLASRVERVVGYMKSAPSLMADELEELRVRLIDMTVQYERLAEQIQLGAADAPSLTSERAGIERIEQVVEEVEQRFERITDVVEEAELARRVEDLSRQVREVEATVQELKQLGT